VCTHCGHDLEVDKSLAMETALSIQGDEGPCSAKNMTFAQTAVYIRTLELQWMRDQRRIRALEQELAMQAQPVIERAAAWPQQDESPRPEGRGLPTVQRLTSSH